MLNLIAINWANVGLQVAQLLLALSILIVIHEFGHYITARWFRCRVEKFFLFFDPWFALVKKKVGDTTYGIGWLPLGGYVKISGMIDESMDKEAMKQPPKDYEFRAKPAWQRLIIMLGGIIMNVLTAFIIYAFILMIWGEKRTPISSLKNGIWVVDSLMYNIGLRNGDKVIAVNGDSIEYFEQIQARVLIGGRSVLIERDGKNMELPVDKNIIGKLVKRKVKRRSFVLPRVPAIIGVYDKEDTAYGKQAGLQPWDRILAVNGRPVQFIDQVNSIADSFRNQSVNVSVLRGTDTLSLINKVTNDGRLGLSMPTSEQYDSMAVFNIDTLKYSFFPAFPAGVRKTGEKLGEYIDQFRLIFDPETEAYKGVGGFKAIGSVFPTEWDWESFWSITAFLSIILAFMNLLPIPALDGGHVMFTLYEMITRRKPNEKFLEYAQITGMVILLLLMLYANGNDWFGWGRG